MDSKYLDDRWLLTCDGGGSRAWEEPQGKSLLLVLFRSRRLWEKSYLREAREGTRERNCGEDTEIKIHIIYTFYMKNMKSLDFLLF